MQRTKNQDFYAKGSRKGFKPSLGYKGSKKHVCYSVFSILDKITNQLYAYIAYCILHLSDKTTCVYNV